ncbi:MAG: hypothetical protein RJA22_1295 [Verrucomicrobiota bacterium]
MHTLPNEAGPGRWTWRWLVRATAFLLGLSGAIAQSTYQFALPTFSIYEGTGPVTNLTVVVLRAGDVSTPGSVSYQATERAPGINSATGGGIDFSTTAGTLNFAPGDLFKTFTVGITADLTQEFSEFFDLSLSGPVGGILGDLSDSEAVIFDDDACFSFSQAVYLVNEVEGSALITICRNPTNAGPASVVLMAMNGTTNGTMTPAALAALDFTALSTNLVFTNNQDCITVTLPIIDDCLVETNSMVTNTSPLFRIENLSLLLTNPIGGSVGAPGCPPPTARVDITDNDTSAGQIVFTIEGPYGAMEDETRAPFLRVFVSRLCGTNGQVTVDFECFNDVIAAPPNLCNGGLDAFWSGQRNDYTIVGWPNLLPSGLPGGTLTWAAGDNSDRIIEFRLVNDTRVELDESIFIRLVRPTGGATVNAQRRINQFIIFNDDAPAGTADTDYNGLGILNPTPGANNSVYASVTYQDGTERTLVGGDFSAYNGIPRNGVARLFESGAVDLSFDPGSGADGFVSKLILQPDGRILVGGGFTSFNNLSRYGVARLNADGSLDPSFDIGAGVNGAVHAMALQPDGKVLIGGEFTRFNNVPRFRVARLNADGSLDQAFDPGTGPNDTVYALGVQPDGKVLVGGSFSQVNGQFYNHVARLQSTGIVDPDWQPVAGADGTVFAIAVQPDGRSLIGGAFRAYDGDGAAGIARLTSAGLLDPGFRACRGMDGVVYAITLLANGQAYVGGDFSVYNETPRANLLRILTNGAVDTLFLDNFYNHTDPGLNSFVATISVQTNGDVMVGGEFSQVGGGWDNLLPPLTRYVPQQGHTEIRFNFARLMGNFTDPLRLGTQVATENAPGNLQFVQPQYSIDENVLGGVLAITLERINGGLSGEQVRWRTVDGSARAGVDYVGAEGAVAWQDCSAGLQLIGIQILDNQIVDGNKNFFIELFEPASLPVPNVIVSNQPALGYNCLAEVTIVDNDVNRGVFGFSQAIFPVNESVGSALITVVRTNGSTGRATVQYQTAAGTALAPGDFSTVSGTLTFETGQTNKTFLVPIINDVATEYEENFSVRLFNASGAALGLSNSTVTVFDNENGRGSLSFSVSDLLVNESAGTALLSVRRTSGSLSNVTVEVASADLAPGPGAARQGVDYLGFTNTLSFTNGATNVVLSIPIIADRFVEGTEAFVLTLRNVTGGAAAGFITNSTVHILDDDAYGRLAFASPSFYGAEEGGFAFVDVTRTGGDAEAVTVDYTVTPGTALDGLDFLTVNGTLTFPDGVRLQTIVVPMIDDPDLEGAETVFVSLANPTKASLEAPTDATLIIVDDESQAVPAGGLDTSFHPQPPPNDFVNVVSLQGDGQILVGGQFTAFGGTGRRRVARLNLDGSIDASFNPGLGANGEVNSIVVQPDGKILLAGAFTQMDIRNRGRIARLTSSGEVDTSFNPGSGADNPVYSMALQPDGKVLLGGDFASYNGIPRSGLARVNATGVLDSGFQPGTGADGTIFALALQPDGKVLVGGEFSTFNNQPVAKLARLNPDGSLDPSFNATSAPNGSVRTIVVQPDGAILIGGAFTSVGTVSRPHVARFLSDGTLDAGFDPGPGANSIVYSAVLQPDGKILLGGEFTTFGGLLNNRIARLRPDGTLDTTINFGTGANLFIASVALQNDGAILIGGGFTTVNGVARPYVARLIGGEDVTPGVLQFVQSSYVVLEDGTNVTVTIARVGGSQGLVEVDLRSVDSGSAVGGVDYEAINRRLTFADGEVFKNITIGITNDALVEPNETFQLALTNVSGGATLDEAAVTVVTIVNDDSAIGFTFPAFNINENVVGGSGVINVERIGATNATHAVNFATVPGSATAGLDYTPVSGTLVFLPGQTNHSFTLPVLDDLAVEGNETLQVILTNLVGQAYFSYATSVVNIVDNDFSPGNLAFSQSAYTVNESNLSVTITVVRTNGLTGVVTADWGTRPITASPGEDYLSPGGVVSFADAETVKTFTIAIVDDSLVEGNETFEVVLSRPTGGSSILGPPSVVVNIEDNEFGPGTLDPSFNPGAGANGYVSAVAVAPGGRILVGGAFDRFGTNNRARVARLLADGSVDSGFDPGGGPNFLVNDLAVYPDGKVAIGGAFTAISGQPYNRVARLDTNGLPDAALASPVNQLNAAVNALATTPAGGVAVGGAFLLPTPRVARFRADGSQDTSFDPGSSIDGAVQAVASFGNGGLLIGGSFTNVDGFRRWKVARLQADGLLDPGFNPPAMSNGVVFALATQADGKVLVAGSFTNLGGSTRGRIARLNGDGSLDNSFDPGLGADGPVRALALQLDGRLLIAGDFLSVNGVARTRVARLNIDGSLDLGFDPGRGADGTIFSIAVDDQGRAVIGGDFTLVNGFPRRGVARLNGDVTALRIADIQVGPAAAMMRLVSSPGARYLLEESTNLFHWRVVGTNTSAGAETTLTNTASAGPGPRFYRVRQVGP